MEFDSDWLTLGRHRVRLRSARGFPTELIRSVAEVVQLAIDNNMSARARLVEIVFQQDHSYEIAVGTTLAEDSVCAPQLEAALAHNGGKRKGAPSDAPIASRPTIITPKNSRACCVAGHRLSARQPSVFGVSRCSRKLKTIQPTNTIHVHRAVNCNCQMNHRIKAGSRVTSAIVKQVVQ